MATPQTADPFPPPATYIRAEPGQGARRRLRQDGFADPSLPGAQQAPAPSPEQRGQPATAAGQPAGATSPGRFGAPPAAAAPAVALPPGPEPGIVSPATQRLPVQPPAPEQRRGPAGVTPSQPLPAGPPVPERFAQQPGAVAPAPAAEIAPIQPYVPPKSPNPTVASAQTIAGALKACMAAGRMPACPAASPCRLPGCRACQR